MLLLCGPVCGNSLGSGLVENADLSSRVALPFSIFNLSPNSTTGAPDLSPTVGCKDLWLFQSAAGRTSPLFFLFTYIVIPSTEFFHFVFSLWFLLASGTGFRFRNWLYSCRSPLHPAMMVMSPLGNQERTHVSVAMASSIHFLCSPGPHAHLYLR